MQFNQFPLTVPSAPLFLLNLPGHVPCLICLIEASLSCLGERGGGLHGDRLLTCTGTKVPWAGKQLPLPLSSSRLHCLSSAFLFFLSDGLFISSPEALCTPLFIYASGDGNGLPRRIEGWKWGELRLCVHGRVCLHSHAGTACALYRGASCFKFEFPYVGTAFKYHCIYASKYIILTPCQYPLCWWRSNENKPSYLVIPTLTH